MTQQIVPNILKAWLSNTREIQHIDLNDNITENLNEFF